MANPASTHVRRRGRTAGTKPPAAQSGRNGKMGEHNPAAATRTTSEQLAAEQRQQLIAEAAYFIAERRGFAPGNEFDDWLQAEAEVEARIKGATQ